MLLYVNQHHHSFSGKSCTHLTSKLVRIVAPIASVIPVDTSPSREMSTSSNRKPVGSIKERLKVVRKDRKQNDSN